MAYSRGATKNISIRLNGARKSNHIAWQKVQLALFTRKTGTIHTRINIRVWSTYHAYSLSREIGEILGLSIVHYLKSTEGKNVLT